MIYRLFWILSTTCLLLQSSASAQTLSFGNVNVVQNDELNNTTSVTVTLDYSHGTISIRTGSNRGDFNLLFGGPANQDRANGILITNISQNGRDNSDAGDAAAIRFATSAIANSSGYFVPVHNTSGGEWNTNFSAAWFPYAEGWIGGHVVNSATDQPMSAVAGSAGLSVSTTAPGSNVIYDDPATNGFYELNLTGINSQTDGILLVVGGANEDNYAMSRANADGTWTVMVRDNGANDAAVGENDGFGFVYVPKTSVVAADQAGVHAMGRVNGNGTADISVGNYVIVRSSTGVYKLYAPGIDPLAATLLLSPEYAIGDNIMTHEAIAHGWEIQNRDLPGAGLQDAGSGDMLSFVLMASGNTAAVWDAEGGANSNWSVAGNWTGDAAPTAGKDVILGTNGSTAQIDSAQTVGTLMINRNTAFTLAGTAPLTVNGGIILNSSPASAQTHIISAPIILGDDAFVISQSLTGSANTLRFDVASGNAITSDGFDLTLSGAGAIEFRDSISLGSGRLFKEGSGQVTLLAANTVGGTVIVAGPTGTTSGAFRLNAAAAYGAFSTGAIALQNGGGVITTALYFDSGAGSGELANDLILQSTNGSSGVRFLADAAAGFDVTMSGNISGGNATSEFVMDSDAANGQGRIHLTDITNTFLASRININRGALVVYGDGSLGDAGNDIYLNTNNTNNNKGSGLHFGANNIVLNENRAVTINTDSVIHTHGFDSTIAGVVSGAGRLIKEGDGILTLSNVNTLTGKVRVNGGLIAISSEEGLGAAPAVFAADQLAMSEGGIKALADLVIDDPNRGITMDSGGGNFDTNGHHVRVDTVITGPGVLSKWGAGTLELTALNTYADMTIVHEGTLAVNNATGSVTGGSTVMVNAVATLAGKGSFNGAVIVEGILGAGISSTGTLVFNGGLDLLAGSRTQFEIASASDYDQIQVMGSPFGVDAEAIFEVIMTGTPMAGWTFDLMDWTFLSLDDDVSDNFVLPDLSAWNLGWNKDNLAEGRLSIVTAVVPEPSRALLLLGGAVACLMRRRR